jgi:hypothetical protein
MQKTTCETANIALAHHVECLRMPALAMRRCALAGCTRPSQQNHPRIPLITYSTVLCHGIMAQKPLLYTLIIPCTTQLPALHLCSLHEKSSEGQKVISSLPSPHHHAYAYGFMDPNTATAGAHHSTPFTRKSPTPLDNCKR